MSYTKRSVREAISIRLCSSWEEVVEALEEGRPAVIPSDVICDTCGECVGGLPCEYCGDVNLKEARYWMDETRVRALDAL